MSVNNCVHIKLLFKSGIYLLLLRRWRRRVLTVGTVRSVIAWVTHKCKEGEGSQDF